MERNMWRTNGRIYWRLGRKLFEGQEVALGGSGVQGRVYFSGVGPARIGRMLRSEPKRGWTRNHLVFRKNSHQ